MTKTQIVKLKEICTHRNDFITISNEKKYKRCRVQLHRKGVALRDEVFGSEIKTKKQRLCKRNDFIVAEMDAKFGGYGIIPSFLEGSIVSSHYYLYQLDEQKILPKYLHVVIQSGKIQEQIKAVGSTNYSRVSPKEVLEYTIPCPDIPKQLKIVERFEKFEKGINQLAHKIFSQQTFLKKLRQSILQDAISGKLTEQWRKENPDVEPASKLLKRINEEKERLVKEKKIPKQKPLPPITEDEIPFELPKGWVWCRLGELGVCQTGTTPTTTDKANFGHYIPFIKPGDITFNSIDYNNEGLSEKGLVEGRLITKGSILMVCIGGSIGKSFYSIRDVSCNQQINTILPLSNIQPSFLHKFLLSPYFQEAVWNRKTGGTTPIINRTRWEMIPLSLPPLIEQKTINFKINNSFVHSEQLEAQITKSRQDSELLMQAVLKEAFEG